jgi:hypothetical protein
MIISGADHNLIKESNSENLPAEQYLKTLVEWTLKQARVES